MNRMYKTFCDEDFLDHIFHVVETIIDEKPIEGLGFSIVAREGFSILGVFNPEQLATWDESKIVAKHFKTPVQGRLIGGGLKPLTSVVETSGIYLLPWIGGPGGFPEPRIGDARSYLFRFKNGFEGVNVGLVREMFRRYPTSPDYAMRKLGEEIGF